MSKVINGTTIPEAQIALNTRELNMCQMLVQELIDDIKSKETVEWLTEADIPELEELSSKLQSALNKALEGVYDVR